jgi:hypothetical protein
MVKSAEEWRLHNAANGMNSRALRGSTMNARTKPTAEPQGAPPYLPTDVTPENLFQAIERLRKEARDEIDRLIRFLDDTDSHMSENRTATRRTATRRSSMTPTRTATLPSRPLAASGAITPTRSDGHGNSRDLEQDDGETGIADQDGLDEQVPFRDWQGVGMV